MASSVLTAELTAKTQAAALYMEGATTAAGSPDQTIVSEYSESRGKLGLLERLAQIDLTVNLQPDRTCVKGAP